jgi:ribosomal protein S18 acetylase RimI-like enzyme
MTATTTGMLRVDRYTPDSVGPLLDLLVDWYCTVIYPDDPVIGDPVRFREQIDGHMRAPRWELYAAVDPAGDLVGILYGFALHPDTAWWGPLITPVPDGFTTETGDRTAAISEIATTEPWRRHGVATMLHEKFIAGRSEERVTLLVQPVNVGARACYERWGYRKVAGAQPTWPNAPAYDSMVLDLI